MVAINEIRAVIFQEGDKWIAQCLEVDIGAQADNLDDLRERLLVAINVECELSVERNGSPFAGIHPAPEHFHKLWDRAGKYTPPDGPTKTSVKCDGESELTVDWAIAA